MGNSSTRESSEMADNSNNGETNYELSDDRDDELPGAKNRGHSALDLPFTDEVPEDIKAFFGHPLTAAETALHGDALALLHEYQHLPSLDKSDFRFSDKYEAFNDILSRSDLRRDSTAEYMTLMATDVFLNRGGDSRKTLSEHLMSQKDSPAELLAEDATGEQFDTFDDPVNLSSQIKQEQLVSDTTDQLLDAIGSVIPSASVSELEASLTVSSAGLAVTNALCSSVHCTVVQPDTTSESKERMSPAQDNIQSVRLPPRLIHMPPPPPGHVYVPTQRLLGSPPPGYVAIPAGLSPHHLFPHEVLIPHGIRPPLDGQLQQLVPVAVGPAVTSIPIAHLHAPNAIKSNPPPLLRTMSAPAQSTTHPHARYVTTSPLKLEATPPPPRYEDLHVQRQQSLPFVNSKTHQYIKTEDEDTDTPSDSTKRIIQVLNEKLKKKSQKLESDDECVSLQEITNMISESMSEEGDKPCVTSVTESEAEWEQWSRPPSTEQQYLTLTSSSSMSPALSPSDTMGQQQQLSEMAVTSSQQTNPKPCLSHNNTSSDTDLKSPDSGFNECCTTDGSASPADSNNNITTTAGYGDLSAVDSGHGPLVPDASISDRIAKRRRSSTSSSLKSLCSATTKNSSITAIPKLENDTTGFKYYLETNTSTSQRVDEDRITYLNKGQFYGLTLEYHPSEKVLKSSTVKTVIMVVFREEKSREDELKAWSFWHSRQHSMKQRILDIDTKNSSGVLSSCIQEISHNAVALRWNPRDQPAKVSIAINCLSTDFSNQKGVKGQPLHVQIDTFEEIKDMVPIHRGYCQIKIFCDKGAERKTRDEERRKEAKTKMADMNGRKRADDLFHTVTERSEFYCMADLTSRPVLFTPDDDPAFRMGDGMRGVSCLDDCDDEYLGAVCSPHKRMRSLSHDHMDSERVLLYVREQQEAVYTALLLQTPTLLSLTHAIEEKYKITASNIENVYKRSRKGILVRMDDNIIRHYSNESTFVISIVSGDNATFDVTLTEIDPADT